MKVFTNKYLTVRTIIFAISVLSIVPVAFSLAAGFYLYTKNLALARERRIISSEARAAKNLIIQGMDQQLNLAKAWASLESANRLTQDDEQDDTDGSLRAEFFRGFGINLLSIYDLNAKNHLELFYFHDASPMPGDEFDIADELLPIVRRVAIRSRVFRRGDADTGFSYSTDPSVSGFMQIDGILFYISAAPIAPLDAKSPESGVLVMGKVLLNRELNKLLELDQSTHFSLRIIDENAELQEIRRELYSNGFVQRYDRSGNILSYQVIESLAGHDILVTLRKDRSFIEREIRIFANASIIIFFTAIAVLTSVVGMLDRILLRRLKHLAQVVDNIKNPNSPPSLPSFKSAELNSLVSALDKLLKRSSNHQKVVEIQNQALIYASRHDKLTGLGNVDHYHLKLKEASLNADNRAGRFAVIAVELNGFRRINEMLGHSAGNEILVSFAARLRAKFPHKDMLFRTGGCEFTIIFSEFASHGDIIIEALNLISCCKQSMMVGNKEILPSVGVGIAVYPDDTSDVVKLEQFVDLALIEAQKASPESQYKFFRPKLYERISEQVFLENEIARALARDEFDVYLQPKLDTATGTIRDAEALVRWHSPSGVINPGRFIPVAETSGLIVPITWKVLDKSCLYANRLHTVGCTDFSVAVNISAQVLHNSEFISHVTAALEKYGLDGKYLNIELTEDVLVEDTKISSDLMYELQRLGIQFSIDDFGTGYSSLRYLHKMPFDWIKIDKTFTDGLPKQKDALAIIDASRAIARSLELGVVFEGVETLQQWNIIAGMQQSATPFYDQIQGYVLSRPLPFDLFMRAMSSWNGPYGPDFGMFDPLDAAASDSRHVV